MTENKTPNQNKIWALVPAAGVGQRFGSQLPKQYQRLAGKPVLQWTLEGLAEHPAIGGVTVSVAAEDEYFDTQVDTQGMPLNLVIGGEDRAQSVLNGLHSIREDHPDVNWVLVHDAVRPCLHNRMLTRFINAALETDVGAILGMPMRDTLKRSTVHGRIEQTVPRRQMWAAQTPQMFPLDMLTHAYQEALAAGEEITDDAMAMEAIGAQPLLVKSSFWNIKITFPEDLALAEVWFRQLRNRGGSGA